MHSDSLMMELKSAMCLKQGTYVGIAWVVIQVKYPTAPVLDLLECETSCDD